MEDIIKEKYISTSPEPVSYKGTKEILGQMDNSVCRIYNTKSNGTGFFTKIPYHSKLLPVLITNSHVIDGDNLKINQSITFSLNKDINDLKVIKLDNNRLRYTNENLDITIIEIKEEKDNLKDEKGKLAIKYLELDDSITSYFKLKEKNDPNYLNKKYSNESIYIINYPEDKDVVVSYGQPPYLTNSEIYHKCSTKEGSSGSPILLINNRKLIGVHYGASKNYEFNKGSLLIYSILEFQKIKNNLLIINKEEENNNYITAEFDIKKDNEEVIIINSYERCYSKWPKNQVKFIKEYCNEEEIKKNCEIRIDEKIIPFSYSYKFDKKGKYNIKYIFKENITKTDYMFSGCSSLTSINLSAFNTNKVKDMRYMFEGCISLTNVNLSNINTFKVEDMCCMFEGCSSLKDINLSNLTTKNVKDMSGMFFDCSSLTNINLSNFITNNVKDMSGMFCKCSSLVKIDLSNFNTNNVTNMRNMFFACSSLTNLDLSNFKTNNVDHMVHMFCGCSSLKSLDLSKFSTNDNTNIDWMFEGCGKLTKKNIIVNDKKIIELLDN